MRILSIAIVSAVCATASLFPAKHPTPLDPDVDGAKCLECHENKSEGKSIHTAVKDGCLTCHEVRVTRDITRVKLTTATVHSLCLKCHADKQSGPGQMLHPPVGRDCSLCHDPHASPNKNHLREALAGGKKENLCLKCHDKGLNISANGSRHEPLDMGCNTCHVIHKKGAQGDLEGSFHLTASPLALCKSCHDTRDESLVKAHQGQLFEKSDCLSCHAIHQSDGPKLVQKFAHKPYADKSCAKCHLAPQNDKVVLTKADPKELCSECHQETTNKIKSATVQHKGAQEDCLGCHDPHASQNPGFVRPDPVNACLKCHDEIAELQGTRKVLHKAAFRDGCATCHEPHGGNRPKLLRADTNDLCLSCHSSDIKPQKVDGQKLVTILGGSVRLPENYFDSVSRVVLKYGQGHPVEKHPVGDFTDPADPGRIKKMSCLTCHQAHAGDARGMLRTNEPPGLAFCSRCHKGMVGAQ